MLAYMETYAWSIVYGASFYKTWGYRLGIDVWFPWGDERTVADREHVKADIWYMEHWMMLFGLYIICKTVANGDCGGEECVLRWKIITING